MPTCRAAIFVVLFCCHMAAQQPGPINEKAAGDEVASLMQQTQQQAKVPKLRRIRDDRLREQACQRAEQGDDSATVVSGFFKEKVGTVSCALYSTSDPSQAPSKVLDWAARSVEPDRNWTAHRFAVGVCFKRTERHPEGRYWVCVSKYLGTLKSFFYSFVWD